MSKPTIPRNLIRPFRKKEGTRRTEAKRISNHGAENESTFKAVSKLLKMLANGLTKLFIENINENELPSFQCSYLSLDAPETKYNIEI